MKHHDIKLVVINLESEEENRWFREGFGFRFMPLDEDDEHHIYHDNIKNEGFLLEKVNARLRLIDGTWDRVIVIEYRKEHRRNLSI